MSVVEVEMKPNIQTSSCKSSSLAFYKLEIFCRNVFRVHLRSRPALFAFCTFFYLVETGVDICHWSSSSSNPPGSMLRPSFILDYPDFVHQNDPNLPLTEMTKTRHLIWIPGRIRFLNLLPNYTPVTSGLLVEKCPVVWFNPAQTSSLALRP